MVEVVEEEDSEGVVEEVEVEVDTLTRDHLRELFHLEHSHIPVKRIWW